MRVDNSTPLVSTQDGPRLMGTSNFGGKKAAPFRKGGKRRDSVMAAKRKKAKQMLRRKVGQDLANETLFGAEIDLGFNPLQPRDRFGKWVRGRGKVHDVLRHAEGGSVFESKGKTWTRGADDRWTSDGSSPMDSSSLASAFPEGMFRTPDDLRIKRDQAHEAALKARDHARARAAGISLSNEVDLASGWQGWNQWRKQHPGSTYADYKAQVGDQRKGKVGHTDRKLNGDIKQPRLNKAIAGFQKSHGLPVTGKLDPATKAKAKAIQAKFKGTGTHQRGMAIANAAEGHARVAGEKIAHWDRQTKKVQAKAARKRVKIGK